LDNHYKMLPEFDEAFGNAVSSLIGCDSLKITGKLRFSPGVICKGAVEFVNASGEVRVVAPGMYSNQRFQI